jgi:hypothetical protein
MALNMNSVGTSAAPANTSGSQQQSNALQSWKEIAAYLKRGVRTAQRWERCAGLPVRRPRPGDRSPVFAFPEEIDSWLHSRPRKRPLGEL